MKAAGIRLLAGVAASALACAGGMPFRDQEDLDADPAHATPIVMGSEVAGTLDCQERGAPDCTDWYRIRPERPGLLELSVTATAGDGEAAPIAIDLADPSGEILGSAEGTGPGGARVTRRVSEPVAFLAAVHTPPATGALSYVLLPGMETAPVAPPTVKTRWTVLEVESRDGETSVLIDAGSANDMHEGYRGRLLEDGKAIGRIEVIEVFEEGSRARVEGPLSGPITANTVAEIEVPEDR